MAIVQTLGSGGDFGFGYEDESFALPEQSGRSSTTPERGSSRDSPGWKRTCLNRSGHHYLGDAHTCYHHARISSMMYSQRLELRFAFEFQVPSGRSLKPMTFCLEESLDNVSLESIFSPSRRSCETLIVLFEYPIQCAFYTVAPSVKSGSIVTVLVIFLLDRADLVSVAHRIKRAKP